MIEILIAMLIMVVGVLPFVLAMQQNMKNRGTSREMTVAMEVGESQVESISANATAWNSLTGTQSGTQTLTVDGRTYTLNWSATPATFLAGGRSIWNIQAQVSWQSYLTRTLSMSRMVMGR